MTSFSVCLRFEIGEGSYRPPTSDQSYFFCFNTLSLLLSPDFELLFSLFQSALGLVYIYICFIYINIDVYLYIFFYIYHYKILKNLSFNVVKYSLSRILFKSKLHRYHRLNPNFILRPKPLSLCFPFMKRTLHAALGWLGLVENSRRYR